MCIIVIYIIKCICLPIIKRGLAVCVPKFQSFNPSEEEVFYAVFLPFSFNEHKLLKCPCLLPLTCRTRNPKCRVLPLLFLYFQLFSMIFDLIMLDFYRITRL